MQIILHRTLAIVLIFFRLVTLPAADSIQCRSVCVFVVADLTIHAPIRIPALDTFCPIVSVILRN